MKLTPLVTLAKLRVPVETDIFGDVLDVASMTVAEGGLITLTCATSHGIAIGASEWVTIADALAPNPITDLVASGADVVVTTQYPHTLTKSTDARYAEYPGYATLTVPGVSGLNGAIYLVSVGSRTSFTVRPATPVTLPGSVQAGSVLLESMESGVKGLNTATATSATVLTMPTPAGVDRDYTVSSPKVSRALRIYGAVDLAHAITHWTDATPSAGRGCLFVTPRRRARLSRDRLSRTDANVEWSPNQSYRQMLMDGFEVYAFVATQSMAAAVGAVDRCNVEVLKGVMRTFNGLRIPFSEFDGGAQFAATMVSHGVETYNKTSYVHLYEFEANVQITAGDGVASGSLPDLATIFADGFDPSVPVVPTGSGPADAITFDPDDGGGIYHDSRDLQPLSGVITLPT